MADALIVTVNSDGTFTENERSFTTKEQAQRAADTKAAEQALAEQALAEQALADAKAGAVAKLTALGISPDEIAALGVAT